MYSVESGSTSSGVFIKVSTGAATRMPMIPIAMPLTMLSAIEVCTVSLTSLSLRAP